MSRDHIRTDTPIYKARLEAGGLAKLAEIIGKTPRQTIKYHHSPEKLPAEDAVKIEEALGIPRHELRPDLFPAPVERGAA